MVLLRWTPGRITEFFWGGVSLCGSQPSMKTHDQKAGSQQHRHRTTDIHIVSSYYFFWCIYLFVFCLLGLLLYNYIILSICTLFMYTWYAFQYITSATALQPGEVPGHTSTSASWKDDVDISSKSALTETCRGRRSIKKLLEVLGHTTTVESIPRQDIKNHDKRVARVAHTLFNWWFVQKFATNRH